MLLVVDDEAEICVILREALEAAGYEVLVAADGAEALAACASHPEVELVVMDIHMPVMGGAAAIRALRAADPARKIIAVSGYSTYEAQALEAGAGWFLVKPYTGESLLALIRQALGRRGGE